MSNNDVEGSGTPELFTCSCRANLPARSPAGLAPSGCRPGHCNLELVSRTSEKQQGGRCFPNATPALPEGSPDLDPWPSVWSTPDLGCLKGVAWKRAIGGEPCRSDAAESSHINVHGTERKHGRGESGTPPTGGCTKWGRPSQSTVLWSDPVSTRRAVVRTCHPRNV